MALGSLISLTFSPKRLAGGAWLFLETLNDLNYSRRPDGQAFVLPSKLRHVRNGKNLKDGENRIDSIEVFGKATPLRFWLDAVTR